MDAGVIALSILGIIGVVFIFGIIIALLPPFDHR
jgi:hypothetical protein